MTTVFSKVGISLGLGLLGVFFAPFAARSAAIAIQPTNLEHPMKTLIAQTSMSEEILAAHNKYRSAVGVEPLTWSDTLASHAQEWANYLASLGGDQLQHSKDTGGEGENLWMGTSGAYNYTQMVDGWGDESQYFVSGTFPDVSSTGNWADVGHYTQMIWKNTQSVGCATASAGGNDILVCRYSPAGNYLGESVY